MSNEVDQSVAHSAPPPGGALLKLIGGRLFGAMATQMQSVVVGWQVFAISHDPLSLGYVGLAQFLPMFALTLPAGDLADRVERRLILATSILVQGLASGLFLILTLEGPHSVKPFYAVLVLFGMARAFSGPAMQSFLPLLVSRERLDKAIAWNSSAFQIAVIAGPALGGGLYLLGPTIAYAACLGLFLAGGLVVLSIAVRRCPEAAPHGLSAFARFSAGIAYVRRQPVVLGAISLDLFAVLFGGATALLPVYAREILAVGPGGLGLLRSSVAVGAFATAVVLSRYSLRRHAGPVMFACVALFGAATIVFGLSTNFAISLAALAVVGGSDMISVYVRSTLIQMATPDAMRGRVSAVNMLFIGASNELGEFESGVTASWFGTVPAVVIGGLGTLLVVGTWMRLFPALRKVDRLSDVAGN